MNEFAIRRFQDKDAEPVSEMIADTLRTTNSRDYSPEYIENDVKKLSPEHIRERAGWTHFYVVCDRKRRGGCGAIGSYWGKRTKAACLPYLCIRIIREKGSEEKSLKRWSRMNFFKCKADRNSGLHYGL